MQPGCRAHRENRDLPTRPVACEARPGRCRSATEVIGVGMIVEDEPEDIVL